MRRLLFAVLFALAALTACGSESSDRATVATRDASPPVADITNVLQLRAAFEDARGKARLLLILSPT